MVSTDRNVCCFYLCLPGVGDAAVIVLKMSSTHRGRDKWLPFRKHFQCISFFDYFCIYISISATFVHMRPNVLIGSDDGDRKLYKQRWYAEAHMHHSASISYKSTIQFLLYMRITCDNQFITLLNQLLQRNWFLYADASVLFIWHFS